MFRLKKKSKSSLTRIKQLKRSKFSSPEYVNFDLFEVPSFIFRSRFPKHEDIKDKILDAIKVTPTSPSRFHNLKKHDWDIPADISRPYSEYFIPGFLEISKPFIDNYTVNSYRYWFNQYEPGESECFIHNHQNASVSGVYFVELEKYKDSTIFVNPSATIGYQVPVKEGDILFWDPMIPHAAPVTKGLKTIISFNLNMIVS